MEEMVAVEDEDEFFGEVGDEGAHGYAYDSEMIQQDEAGGYVDDDFDEGCEHDDAGLFQSYEDGLWEDHAADDEHQEDVEDGCAFDELGVEKDGIEPFAGYQ